LRLPAIALRVTAILMLGMFAAMLVGILLTYARGGSENFADAGQQHGGDLRSDPHAPRAAIFGVHYRRH
jgi:formate hydrogenlyase subunit 3/multisubunit Na+/H+ antiporter MnhD subunit